MPVLPALHDGASNDRHSSSALDWKDAALTARAMPRPCRVTTSIHIPLTQKRRREAWLNGLAGRRIVARTSELRPALSSGARTSARVGGKGDFEMSKPVKPVPAGYHTVTPWIIGRDTAGLIEFLKAAFNATETNSTNKDGRVGHAEVRIGDSVVMMFDAPRDRGWPDTRAFLRLYLPDADATFARAVAAGAVPVTKVTHLAFGDRVGRVRDPYGNVWWLQTRVEKMSETS